MTRHARRRTPRFRRPRLIAAVLSVAAVIAVAAVAVAVVVAGDPHARSAVRHLESTIAAHASGASVQSDPADGAIADGAWVSPYDTDQPAVANLDPALRAALQHAYDDAKADAVELYVNSGWRSTTLQTSLLDDAIVKYGSREEALQWVSTPDASHHVTGRAVDLGPLAKLSWLEEHGADYGLCRPYENESWHWEMLADADGVCPPRIANAAGAGA